MNVRLFALAALSWFLASATHADMWAPVVKDDPYSSVIVTYARAPATTECARPGSYVEIRAVKPRSGGPAAASLHVYLLRIDADMRISDVGLLNWGSLTEISNDAGNFNCSRYGCRADYVAGYDVPAAALVQAQKANAMNVRVAFNGPPKCDFQSIVPASAWTAIGLGPDQAR